MTPPAAAPPPDESTDAKVRADTPAAARTGRRRLSLRARLIGLVVAVAAVALIAVDVTIPLVTRASLIGAKDQTLASVIATLKQNRDPFATVQQQLASNPLAGELGVSVIRGEGAAHVLSTPAGAPDANPAVGHDPLPGVPFTVGDASGRTAVYRAEAEPGVDRSSGAQVTLVFWIPMSDIESTVDTIVLLEVLVSLGLLVLLGAVAGFAVRRELRPLQSMARAAHEIAAGDLSRRVAPGAPGTEVGRLGAAFNGMVDSVSSLLADREASEDRMRQFVADASHELRTPVAAIRGYTDLYRAGALEEQDSVERAMERMGFESQRMGALVEDLLTLTQTDADAVRPVDAVDLVSVLRGVVDDAVVIDRSRTWRLTSTVEPVTVRGDRLRLHQLFANLLANVRTHTPPGTSTMVSVSVFHSMQGLVAVVNVMDNGPGVDAASLPRLFDRFFRVDKARSREQGGSGLGLSIVASIVRLHGGAVGASPTPGGGLTVTVQLPVATPEAGHGG
jgi:two-component system OmpR family sensor kinase